VSARGDGVTAQEFLRRIRDQWQPHPGQRAFLEATARVRVLACGRRWGKTEACAVDVLANWWQRPELRQLIVAPTSQQVRFLFARVLDWLATLQRRVFADRGKRVVREGLYPEVRLDEGVVRARSGHRPDSLRGDEADHIIVDEAAYVHPDLIGRVLLPMLATTRGRLTLLSTPNGFNDFWRAFADAEAGAPDHWCHRAPSDENPRVDPQFLQWQREREPDAVFRVEYLAEFRDAAGAVFRSEDIDRAMAHSLAEPSESTAWFAGLDWGLFHDATALAIGQRTDRAQVLGVPAFVPGSAGKAVAWVLDQIRDYSGITVFAEDNNFGGVLNEQLRREARSAGQPMRVVDRHTGHDRKAEWIHAFASALERDDVVLPRDPALRQELLGFRAQPLPSGAVRLAAQGREHDDRVMALALLLAHLPAVGGTQRTLYEVF
jgi:hypothetical protein